MPSPPTACLPVPSRPTPHTLQYKETVLNDEMQRMNVNLEAIEAYRQKDADYSERVRELEAATAERDTVGGGWGPTLWAGLGLLPLWMDSHRLDADWLVADCWGCD